jgi:hypothetical protein
VYLPLTTDYHYCRIYSHCFKTSVLLNVPPSLKRMEPRRDTDLLNCKTAACLIVLLSLQADDLLVIVCSALEEDAIKAVAELNNHVFKGRKLQLEIALKKGMNPVKDSKEHAVGADSAPVVEKPAVIKPAPAPQPRSAISVGLEAAVKQTPVNQSSEKSKSKNQLKKEKKQQSKEAKKQQQKQQKQGQNEANDDDASGTVATALQSIACPDTDGAGDGSQSTTGQSKKEGLSRARRLLVWGLPNIVNKHALKILVSKTSRKAEVNLIREVRKSTFLMTLEQT